MTDEDYKLMAKLLKRLVKGDKSAYDKLYTKFFNVIYCFVLKYVKIKEVAEDIAQETFMKICEPTFKIRLFTNPSALFITIAKNKALDYLRLNKRKTQYIRLAINTEKSKIEEVENDFELKNLLKGLTKRQKVLLRLRCICNLKVQDISKLLGVSKRTLNRDFGEMREKIEKNIKEEIA